MKTLMLFLLIFLLTAMNLVAQNYEWTVYQRNPDSRFAEKIVFGNHIYFRDDGNLIKLNMQTGEKNYYLKSQTSLEKSYLYDICLDSAGIIWFCNGKKGIVSFDPTKEQFTSFDNKSLYDKCKVDLKIVKCAVDTAGNVWFYAEEKYNGERNYYLIKYDGEDFTCTKRNFCNNIYSLNLISDRKGNLWFGRDSLYCYKNNTISIFPLRENIETWNIKSMASDSKGNIWYAFSTFLNKFDGVNYENWDLAFFNLPDRKIYKVFIDSKDRIWISTLSSLYMFNGSDFIKQDLSHLNLSDDKIRSFSEDPDGNVLLCTKNKILKYDGSEYSLVQGTNTEFPSTNHITDLEVKNAGEAYFTVSSSKTLHKLKDDKFEQFEAKSELFNIDFDSNEMLWINGGYALISFDGSDFKYLATPDSLTSLTVDKDDNIWFTSNYMSGSGAGYSLGGHGIYKYDGSDFINYKDGFLGRYVEYIDFAPDGSVLLTSINESRDEFGLFIHYYGLIKISDGDIKHYTEENSDIPSNGINSLAIDGKGKIWMNCKYVPILGPPFDSTKWYGLTRFDGKQWKTYNCENSGLPSNKIDLLKVDNQDRVWIINYARIIIFDGKSRLDSISHQFDAGSIKSLQFDSKGNAWIMLQRGDYPLIKINPDDKIEKFNNENSPLPDNDISFLKVDRFDNIWIDSKYALIRLKQTDASPVESYSITEDKLQAYPNPFSQSTTINYELREAGYISLELFDMLGNKIATLVDDWRESGRHEARFDATALPSGVYLIELRSGGQILTNKIIISH